MNVCFVLILIAYLVLQQIFLNVLNVIQQHIGFSMIVLQAVLIIIIKMELIVQETNHQQMIQTKTVIQLTLIVLIIIIPIILILLISHQILQESKNRLCNF